MLAVWGNGFVIVDVALCFLAGVRVVFSDLLSIRRGCPCGFDGQTSLFRKVYYMCIGNSPCSVSPLSGVPSFRVLCMRGAFCATWT